MQGDADRRQAQLRQVRANQGLFVALDQSKGVTPRMLRLYGINVTDYYGEHEMLAHAHEMRTRICTSPTFGSPAVLGAILCDDTVEQGFCGRRAADYLWEVKRVVPFLKVDRGLDEERGGVQLMNAISDLDARLDRAVTSGMFGIKARCLVKRPNVEGIRNVVAQQLQVASRAWECGLVPIVEVQVSARCQEKVECEELLREALLKGLESLAEDANVIFRLTIPSTVDFYRPLLDHPKTLRVLAFGGSTSQTEACTHLAKHPDLTACFCNAFLEGLHVNQLHADFESTLERTCRTILKASSAICSVDATLAETCRAIMHQATMAMDSCEKASLA